MSQNEGDASSAYRPTSLDFINRPNPVEPQSVQGSHARNGPTRLEQIPRDDLMRMIFEEKGYGQVSERIKPGRNDGNLLDLPKLPEVKTGTKRLRIPPTLSGLHQPPPDAGLLPSISVEQPVSLGGTKRIAPLASTASWPLDSATADSDKNRRGSHGRVDKPTTKTKRKRFKWTEEETNDLLRGVKKFGIGNWTAILKCSDYNFQNRSAIDLKDRFRVCCPSGIEWRSIKIRKNAVESSDSNPAECPTRKKTDQKSASDLLELGIDEPFTKSQRRTRTIYTPAEDEALFKGWKKHGNAWASIQQDPELGLDRRKPTDLRDRFRTRFPEQYREAGLAPRPVDFPNRSPARTPIDETPPTAVAQNNPNSSGEARQQPAASITEKQNEHSQLLSAGKTRPAVSLLQSSDVFWGAPLDYDADDDLTRPTLDRGILDWPFDISRAAGVLLSSRVGNEAQNLQQQGTSTASHPAFNIDGASANNSAPLPSLATITAVVEGDHDDSGTLELPSLVGGLASADFDMRMATNIPSLEELMRGVG